MTKDIINQNKIFLWIAVATASILFIPFIAMQFTSEVNWGREDFVVMGVLISGIASLFVLVARLITKKSHRIITAIILTLAFLYIWAELAVGIFTNLGS